MRKSVKSILSLFFAAILAASMLSACNKKAVDEDAQKQNVPTTIVSNTQLVDSTVIPTVSVNPTAVPVQTVTKSPDPIANLTETQRNSINMLNWLAYLTQEINASSNNRLYIEEVYSLIVNQTYPNAVDSHTQDRLLGIRQALLRYRMVDVKRERIEYLYEQSKAQSIKAAIPDPSAVMKALKFNSLSKVATSLASIAINSINSYQYASAQAELEYLRDGWELNDDADDVFYTLRSDAFDYMIDMVREYDIPGYMSLNEQSINQFVSWKNNPDVVRRIRFLETNVDTYRAFGSYWLLLAESYYNNENYKKCLDAVHSYEGLSTRIFRRDKEYATVLTLAVAAAGYTLTEEEYIDVANRYAETILSNIGNDDWSLRYFAALTYADLYARTGDDAYLWKCYNVVLDNVNYLIDTQTDLNARYLSEVKEEPVPAGSTKDKETQIEAYNKLINEKRKTELPPVYEPLLLNCELLFTVADQMNISDAEQQNVDKILHANGNRLFLIDALDNKYRYSGKTETDTVLMDMVCFDGDELIIPAEFLTEQGVVTVTVTDTDGAVNTFTDWVIESVKRDTEGNLSTFTVVMESETADDFDYGIGMKVEIAIQAHKDYKADIISFVYEVTDNKPNWYDYLGVWNSDLAFEKVK